MQRENCSMPTTTRTHRSGSYSRKYLHEKSMRKKAMGRRARERERKKESER